MTKTRKIEIFSGNCPLCTQAIELVESIAGDACQINVLDMHDASVMRRASEMGIRTVPAVTIDGKLADCCQSRGLLKATLLASGIGDPS